MVDLPMRDDLKVGNAFPDFELPDHTGTQRRLSHLLRGFPGALIFDRGNF
jgi:peroxiredoxin